MGVAMEVVALEGTKEAIMEEVVALGAWAVEEASLDLVVADSVAVEGTMEGTMEGLGVVDMGDLVVASEAQGVVDGNHFTKADFNHQILFLT